MVCSSSFKHSTSRKANFQPKYSLDAQHTKGQFKFRHNQNTNKTSPNRTVQNILAQNLKIERFSKTYMDLQILILTKILASPATRNLPAKLN